MMQFVSELLDLADVAKFRPRLTPLVARAPTSMVCRHSDKLTNEINKTQIKS